MRIENYITGTASDGRMVYPPAKHAFDRFCRNWLCENFLMSVTSVHFSAPFPDANGLPHCCDVDNDFRFNSELIEALQTLPDLESVSIECPKTIPRENIEYAKRALPKVAFEFEDREMLSSFIPPFATED